MTPSIQPFPRCQVHRLRRDLELYPAVAVMGARQVGKTTLTRQLAQERGLAYLSLDERAVRAQALDDPEGLLDSVAPTGAVFDEIQRAPGLLLALKTVVDREQRSGRFLLTGSNQPEVSSQVADSLLGRVGYRTLRPLTLREQRYDDTESRWTWFFEQDTTSMEQRLREAAGLSGELDWARVVSGGGMPRALAAPPADRTQILEDYLRTFAERDIREVLAVDSGDRFESFLRLVAARTGQELNASGLSGDLGISVTTVRRWIGALERSYLITLVPPYSRNASLRVIKSPKIFLVDSALALAGAREPWPNGFHLETLVANDLLAWRDEAPGRAVYHWRLQSGQEVDFVLEHRGVLVAVEVKTTDQAQRRDARHLAAFLERYPECVRGVLLTSDPGIRHLGERLLAAPWWAAL